MKRQPPVIQIAAGTLAVFAVGLSSVSGCGGIGGDGDGGRGARMASVPTEGKNCSTVEATGAERAAIEAALLVSPRSRAGGNITIPVYAHIITSDTGEGDVSDATIATQISILNTAFAGQQAPGGYDTSFRFQLVSTDRTANSVWYTSTQYSPEEAAMKTALRKGSADDLNLYVQGGGVGGWASVYWRSSGLHWDGITVRNPNFLGGSNTGSNLGDTAVHEVGHWLGLDHTFQGGCSKTNDSVSDTPAERTPNTACPVGTRDTCTGSQFRGNDPTMNFMDYTPDECQYQFTAGQNARMDKFWTTYRAGK